MKFSLAAMIRRVRNVRRRSIPIRDIAPPGVRATDLYRSCYLPVVQAWERGIVRIMAEYERSLAAITTDSAAELGQEISSIADEVLRLFVNLTPRMRDWLVQTESWHRGRWRGAVLSATGIDLQTMIGPEDVGDTLETLLGRNAGLVRDISDEARGRIADAVYRGLSNRLPAAQVAKDIRGTVDMARDRAKRVAADQLAKAASALDTERMRQAGIDAWLWKHSGKLHFRPEHKARDGKRYTFDDPPPDMPGELPFCGCRKLAVVEFD